MTYIIAFHFESFGPIPTIHGFTHLSAVIGNLNSGHIVNTFCEYANQENYISDSEYIETFWSKNPEKYQDTLEKCTNSTNHPQEVIELFIKWVNKFIEERSFYLITDSSTYDSGILKTFSLCNTLKIVTKCPRNITDTTSFFLGVSRLFITEDVVDESSFELARKALNLPVFKSTTKSDDPVYNATMIFENYKYINDGLIDLI
jgi:hypothetical protein